MRIVGVAGRIVLVAATAALAGCSPNAVALKWLEHDCTVGEPGRLETELRNEGERAEKTLVRAFERGPSTELIEEVAAEAGGEYDEVASAINAGRTYGLSRGEIASVIAISRDEHMRRARAEFDRAYRATALSGLGVLSLRRGMELLRRVAADPRSPDRAIALLALRSASRLPRSP